MLLADNNWMLAGGAALVGVVAAGWDRVRSAWEQLLSRIVVSCELEDHVAEAVFLYCRDHLDSSRWGHRRYASWWAWVRPRGRRQVVAYERPGVGGRLYWRGWRPLKLTRLSAPKDETSAGLSIDDLVRVTFLRGMYQLEPLLMAALDYYNARYRSFEDGSHFVRVVSGTDGKPASRTHDAVEARETGGDARHLLPYRLLQWTHDQLEPVRPAGAVERLALEGEAVGLLDEARRWLGLQDWYRELGVPWRRGWLLHGSPGTGKTALVRAIAEDLDLPVFAFDLATLFNDEMRSGWRDMLAHAPCLALIEDIDAVFEHRTNRAGKLSFDCLLNCIDGVDRAGGALTVITTNHPELVDPALGGFADGEHARPRPGRIDRVVAMRALTERGRAKLVRRFLAPWPELWDLVIRAGAEETGAEFQERCVHLALARLGGPDAETPRELSVSARANGTSSRRSATLAG